MNTLINDRVVREEEFKIYGVKLDGHKFKVFRRKDNKILKMYDDFTTAMSYIRKKNSLSHP